jgi:hypothetical protein
VLQINNFYQDREGHQNEEINPTASIFVSELSAYKKISLTYLLPLHPLPALFAISQAGISAKNL